MAAENSGLEFGGIGDICAHLNSFVICTDMYMLKPVAYANSFAESSLYEENKVN